MSDPLTPEGRELLEAMAEIINEHECCPDRSAHTAPTVTCPQSSEAKSNAVEDCPDCDVDDLSEKPHPDDCPSCGGSDTAPAVTDGWREQMPADLAARYLTDARFARWVDAAANALAAARARQENRDG